MLYKNKVSQPHNSGVRIVWLQTNNENTSTTIIRRQGPNYYSSQKLGYAGACWLEKPALLVIRFLFGFALDQSNSTKISTNCETAMQCSQQFLRLRYSDSNIFIPVAKSTCIEVQRSQHFNSAFTQSWIPNLVNMSPVHASEQLLHKQPWAEKWLLTCESFHELSPLH